MGMLATSWNSHSKVGWSSPAGEVIVKCYADEMATYFKWCYISVQLYLYFYHMCGSWYLPVDGSLILISIASLMALVICKFSLSTILKLSRDNLWWVMLWWLWMGEGALICSLKPSLFWAHFSEIIGWSSRTLLTQVNFLFCIVGGHLAFGGCCI